MPPRIKPIETNYRGHRFRSRLEARWAVFFDTAGIPYQYELEGYELSDGTLYLPDFYLPTVNLRDTRPGNGIYVEIKGGDPSKEERAKLDRFVIDARVDLALLVGGVFNDDVYQQPAPGAPGDDGHYQLSATVSEFSTVTPKLHYHVWWDNLMRFMRCYECGAIKYEFLESNYTRCEACGSQADEDHPSLVKAVSAARSARFEHGENGA